MIDFSSPLPGLWSMKMRLALSLFSVVALALAPVVGFAETRVSLPEEDAFAIVHLSASEITVEEGWLVSAAAMHWLFSKDSAIVALQLNLRGEDAFETVDDAVVARGRGTTLLHARVKPEDLSEKYPLVARIVLSTEVDSQESVLWMDSRKAREPMFLDFAMDTLKLISVSPESVVDGEVRDLTVRVKYVLSSSDAGFVELGFTLASPSGFRMVDRRKVTKGEGELEIVTPVAGRYWSEDQPFRMLCNLTKGDRGVAYSPLASQTIDLKVEASSISAD